MMGLGYLFKVVTYRERDRERETDRGDERDSERQIDRGGKREGWKTECLELESN